MIATDGLKPIAQESIAMLRDTAKGVRKWTGMLPAWTVIGNGAAITMQTGITALLM